MAGLLQYFVNEAESGTTPTTLTDTGSAGLDLNIDYGVGGTDAEWVGAGFRITAAGNTSTAGFRAALNAAVISALSNSNQFTFFFRQAGLGAATPFGTIFQISDGVTVPLELRLADIGLLGLYVNGEASALDQYGGDVTVFRVDTTLASATDRVKLDVREFASNTSRDMTNNAVSQNTNLGDLTGHTVSILNNFDQDSNITNPSGVLAYFEIYDRVLSDAEVSTVLTELENNFDSDPLGSPTVSFVAGPTVSNASSSGFDLSLTTNLNTTVDVVITESTTQPLDTVFDAATFGGNSTAFTVYNESITGLNPETLYYAHVRITDGATTAYAYDSITTTAVQSTILTINGGQPIRYGQTGIVVTWDAGATGTTSTAINDITQQNHTVVNDTTTTFDLVWPEVLYGNTATLTVDGLNPTTTPSIQPILGYSYVTLANYNPAATGAIQTTPQAVDGDQFVYNTENSSIFVSTSGIPNFTASFDGDLTVAVVDSSDGTHSAFSTLYYQAPQDIIPDAIDLGADVTGAEPNSEHIGNFTLLGVDSGVDIIVPATGSMLLSLSATGPWTTSVTAQLNTVIYHRLVSGTYDAVVTGGVSVNGVVDTRSVTTRSAVQPVITVQPQPQNVTSGDSVTFSVSATGATSYQWYQAPSTLLTGQTSSSLTFTASLDDNGNSYYVQIAGPESNINSDTVSLTVQAPNLTITSQTMRDAVTKNVRANEANIPVKIKDILGNTLLDTTVTTDASGIWSLTSTLFGDIGDTVYVEFPHSPSGTYVGFTYTLT